MMRGREGGGKGGDGGSGWGVGMGRHAPRMRIISDYEGGREGGREGGMDELKLWFAGKPYNIDNDELLCSSIPRTLACTQYKLLLMAGIVW